MATARELDAADRDFFRSLVRVSFSNPFLPETVKLQSIVAGGQFNDHELLSRQMITRIDQRLRGLSAGKTLDWKHFTGEDRELVRVALLHDTYHRCCNEFDELIVRQNEAGEDLCKAPFASDILMLLHHRGFSVDESLRYFAFYYQLRRAWYFIHHGLIGDNASMEKLRADLWQAVFTYDAHWYELFLWNRMEDFSTFLVGETGTGKGTAAAAIGRSGFIPFDENKERFSESFTSNLIEINLSQFPESLIESELFGHRKGAFTGAVDNYRGVFALCTNFGSIFLDEIGDVSIPVQIKLLKVLEERQFSAVGSHEKLHFHGRVIAATNKPLDELRSENIFRRDFYYRICSNVIAVPTLRQQIQEDPSALETLLKHTIVSIIGEPSPELLGIVLEVIDSGVGSDYHWPGNVRELEQAVRNVLLNRYYCGELVEKRRGVEGTLRQLAEQNPISARELLSCYCSLLYERYGTYEQVASVTGLDPRTVKKYIRFAPVQK